MGDGRCFCQPIALFDRHLNLRVYRVDQLLCQRRSPGIQHSKGAKVIFFDSRMLSKEQDHRRNDICIGYPVILDYGAKFLNLELCHHRNRYPAVNTVVNQACQT